MILTYAREAWIIAVCTRKRPTLISSQQLQRATLPPWSTHLSIYLSIRLTSQRHQRRRDRRRPRRCREQTLSSPLYLPVIKRWRAMTRARLIARVHSNYSHHHHHQAAGQLLKEIISRACLSSPNLDTFATPADLSVAHFCRRYIDIDITSWFSLSICAGLDVSLSLHPVCISAHRDVY